jgi:hypothetical protein
MARRLSEGATRGVGVVDPTGGELEQLLTLPGCGVGQVDDVEDLGTAGAGDLPGASSEARTSLLPERRPWGRERSRTDLVLVHPGVPGFSGSPSGCAAWPRAGDTHDRASYSSMQRGVKTEVRT